MTKCKFEEANYGDVGLFVELSPAFVVRDVLVRQMADRKTSLAFPFAALKLKLVVR